MCQVLLLDNRANSACIKNLFERVWFQNPLISLQVGQEMAASV